MIDEFAEFLDEEDYEKPGNGLESTAPFAGLMETEVSYEELKAKHEAGEFFEWNYKSFDPRSTGYEDVEPLLKTYTAERYMAASEEDQVKMVEDVLAIYREKDIFPITYFNDLGILDEIYKCISYDAKFEGNVVSTGQGVGSAMCNFLMPNLMQTPSAKEFTPDKAGAETAYLKFKSDKFMKKAIRFCFSYNGGEPVPSSIFGALRLVGSAPTNFRPMNAKAIFERFTPVGGTIYDFSTGFGGRLLGALSSKNNYRYIGTDPNTETMWNLHKMAKAIEVVTGRTNSYELHCVGSEMFKGPENSVDFAFSSPPYFNLELYSDEPTQCYNKYPELNGWLEGYVRETIQNIKTMLKPGALYAVNIADFDNGSESVQYVDAWRDISEQEGLPHFNTVYLGVKARAGSQQMKQGEHKKENILLFKKP